MNSLRARLSYANVMSTVAAFAAIATGSAYAVNRLDGGDISKRSIPGNRLVRESVGSREVRNLRATDFKSGQLPAGETGVAGETGAAGAPGVAGPPGTPGISGLELITQSSGAQNSSSGKQATATCSAGKRVIGASAEIQGGVDGVAPNELEHVAIDEVVPTPESVVPGSVTVQAYELSATLLNWSVQAYALCANVS